MKLTRDCKVILDTVRAIEPNNGMRFYTNDYVFAALPENSMSPDDFSGVLETLSEVHAIIWGDKEHSGFSLTEIGKEYKQIDRLERMEQWKERGIGFIMGLVSGLVLAFLIKLLQL